MDDHGTRNDHAFTPRDGSGDGRTKASGRCSGATGSGRAGRAGTARQPDRRVVRAHRRRHLRAAVPPARVRSPARLGRLALLRPLAQLAHRPRPRRRAREAARRRPAERRRQRGRARPGTNSRRKRSTGMHRTPSRSRVSLPRYSGAAARVRERRHFQKPAEVIQAPHQPLRLHLLLQVQVDVAAQGSVRRLRRGDDTAAAVSRRRAAR